MAAHEYDFSDKCSCPINLNGTHLRIIRNNETDRQTVPITPKEFTSENHYRGKAIASFEPTT